MNERSRNVTHLGNPRANAIKATEDPATVLVGITSDLTLELHPHRKAFSHINLDSSLERDLGFDSLGEIELLQRLERRFGVELPENLLARAETLHDLLDAVRQAEVLERVSSAADPARVPSLDTLESEPEEATTLTEVLEWHQQAHPDRPHILLAGKAGENQAITYGELAADAKVVARGLRRDGLEPGDRVAIMLPTGQAFFLSFFGALYAGGIPVPLYPPMRRSQIEEHLRRQAGILKNCEARILISDPEARALTALLRSQVRALEAMTTVEALMESDNVETLPSITPEGTALLQYTSGSTGNPKGVVLTHRNLLANIRAMGGTMNASSSDLFVSWLPLYHDMGLIGAWLGSLYYGAPAVIMSPLRFLTRPESWLWAIHRHRATLSAAPNFAFELCLSRIRDEAIRGLDLSSLRMVANGAEAISADTIRRFTERFGRFGFHAEAMAPVYGLAESSVGLAFPPPDRLPIIDRVQRGSLIRWGKALPADAKDSNALEFVACGQPLPGHQIRIVDDTGHEVGDRQQGRLQFRGPSATSGYFRDPANTRGLFVGDWLDSGDLAYIASGDAYVTGRIKDIIIRAGQNIYPQEVEEAIAELEGIRRGCNAVFGHVDPKTGTERIVVLAETRETDQQAIEALRQRVADVALDLIGSPPDDVILAPPRSVPKTSSGKLRRSAARELYLAGRIGTRPRTLRWQIARLTLASTVPQGLRALKALGEVFYAGYWWTVVAVLGAATWLSVLALPKTSWRWMMVHRAARLALRLMGARLLVRGLDMVPDGGCILVVNHASYLDGLVLAAALPGQPVFVAKKELASQFVAGHFLGRLGTFYVERGDAEGGLEDIEKALEVARAGKRIVFFPEGTLARMPGLLPFHLGAFQIAAKSGLPLVPLALRGTRSILRGGQWFPRRGPVTLEVGIPLTSDGDDFAATLGLRDAARARILALCGEPDLGQ